MTVYLSGYTPKPLDRFGRIRKDIGKVSLGSENDLSIESVDDPYSFIVDLKKKGVSIIALEQSAQSKNYRTYTPTSPLLLIVGEEVSGIEPQLLGMADEVIEIPMRGNKESLNVSVATGIALFQIAGL
jgi:23S rRNA (guanosine2251-2'-O)-methyltransferase